MSICLDVYDLSKLNMKGIKNLKISIVINKSKSVIKCSPYKEISRLDSLNDELLQI